MIKWSNGSIDFGKSKEDYESMNMRTPDNIGIISEYNGTID